MKKQLKSLRDLILYHLPKSIAHKYLYNKYHTSKIDLENPLTYDEKIHWLMINEYDEKYSRFADKISVRDYVASCNLQSLLIPLVGKGVYKSADLIDFDELPNQFIVKTNHGSGENYYYICENKNEIDRKQFDLKMNRALKTNFAIHFCQYHYAGINPALICEKFLKTSGQDRLTDYKVVCTFGMPVAILVCKARNNGRDYYSTDWDYLDYVLPQYKSGIIEDKPIVLDKMLNAASILSKPLPLARVDFYVVDGELYFGEITLTPSEGTNSYLNKKGQLEIGGKIRLTQ